MKNKQLYTIALNGLPTGFHTFGFKIDDTFFETFEGSEVQHGALTATVIADKKNTFLQLDVAIAGTVTVECDRCLDLLEMPVQFRGTPLAKVVQPPESEQESDGEEWLPIDAVTNEVDLTQYFYDSIILSLPIQRVHKAGKCNKEMMKKLICCR